MSHHLYNLYASANQSSTQGQYGLPNIQAERDPRSLPSRLGPRSSFNLSGASATSDNSGGILPSLMSQSMSYRPEQSRATMDEHIERSIDMHISRAREEVRISGKLIHQSIDQDTRFTSTHRDELRSSGARMASYPMSSTSTSLGHRHLDIESGSSSMDWSSNYKRPTADDSKSYSSSALFNYASGGDNRFNAPSEREHDMKSIPGLGDYDYPLQDKPAAPTESSRPKHTSESAVDILLRFGLEKEDLEYLISYPEDQITPATLPFILRQIRTQKAKRATTAVQPKSYPETQPTRSLSGMDGHTLSSYGRAGMRQEEMASSVLQPSKVIDYGHTGKYTGGVGDNIGRSSGSRANSGGSGSMLLMDTYDTSRHNREPLQKNTTGMKSSALSSSREQASSVTSLSSSYSSIPNSGAAPSHDQTKGFQSQPNQTSQTVLGSFSLPKKDTDIRVFKSEGFKPVPLKEPVADRQSTSKTQPSRTLLRGVHPSRPGLVLIGSNDNSGTKGQSKTQGQGSAVAEQMKKRQIHQQKQPMQQMQKQPMQQMQKQPMQQMQKQPMQQMQKQPVQQMQKQPMQQMQKQPMAQQSQHQMQTMQQQQQSQPVSQTGLEMWPPVFSAANSVPPVILSNTDASQTLRCPVLTTGDPRPIFFPPAQPHPILALLSLNPKTMPTSNRQPPAKTGVSKSLPMPAMMHDYAAASPRIFPHTCSLCNKECTCMKDWISHQNTSLHLEKCKYLRKQYPDWDGEIILESRAAGKDAKPSPSTSAQTSQHHREKTRHGSRSCSRSPSHSPSPRRHRGSEGRREKRSSRSRSPHGSRYAHRSQSRSLSPRYDRPTSYRYRSHSWSPERRPSPRRRDDRRSSPTRSRERRSSPRRGEERGSPPRRSDKRRSPPRRSRERRSPPRRGEERGSPPRRSDERRSPPRRSRERRSPPRRGEERGSPPRRSDERRSPPRRSRESRSSTEGSSPQRNKSSSAGRLVKKLLETSAVRSLSKQSDLEVMVKTLTPALLAELAKMESPSSSSSSSSSSTAKKKVLTLKPSKAKPSLQKSEARSSTKTKSGKSSPPTMVKLQGITSCHSHNDVVAAVEQFGKTKSVVLFRSKLEAIVCFEKEEDAKKLKSAESFDVKGMAVAVVREKETVSMEQKKPPQKKPATSSVSTPQTTKATTTSTTTNVPLPTPNMPPLKGLLPSGAKKATTGKLTNQKIAAKGSVKGLTTVTKAKVLVSKAKNISTKQIAKTVKTGTLSAKEAVKKKMSSGSKCTAPDNQSDSGESAMVLKEAASQMQQRVSSSPTEAAVGDPATAAETQTNAASAKDASVTTEPTAAAVSERQPAASTPSLTEKHLHRDRIHCLKMQTCFSKKLFLLDRTVLLVTELPKFYDGCYTEEDVAELLAPFGFEYKDDTIYIDPQTCMAFVMMPTAVNTHNIILFSAKNGIFLKGSRLGFHVVNTSVTMTPSGSHDGVRAIFIKNISPSEVRDLREALKKIGSVTNFVPFLNKVFIEFERNHDADRLGVWFSLLKQAPGYEVHRLMVPHITHASLSPRLPENALPDCKDVVAGATIPPVEFGVPQGSMPPFWVTLRTSPFVFPTLSPWFIIPEYLTVRGMADIEEASGRGYTNPTIMLTGLPEGDYKHEDVAKLVWQYFPKQNLHSLYYNVTVLTLQRRAFVYFADWTTCCDFVRDHITNPVSVRGCTLTVHFVLQHMNPESSEEMMYKTLMKWSNAGVLEPKSLEERLLCVETSESSVAVVGSIMEAVASITTFVSFLPLANRICIEMADSSGVTQVVEKCKGFSPDSFEKRWSKVLRVETLKSLKQRLQDASDIPINFEADTLYDEADSPAVKCQTLPPSSELLDTGCQATLQASCPDGSTISEPTTAGPSATTASDVAMKEEDEKPGSEITISSFGPEANVDVEKVKREEGSLTTSISTADVTSTSGASSGNTDPAASSPSPSGTQLQPEENFAELPQINTEIFKALTAAVRQHRLTRESRSQSEEKENPSKTVTSSTVVTAEDTPQRMGQDDVTDDIVSSDSYHFEEQKLNIDDFVTVDEVGDNVEDTSPEAHSSSSSSRARRERQSSGVSSCGKQTSTRSLKDSKSSASPSSSSSKSTKGSSSSSSRSGSPKMSKGSSDPTKSPTKPSSSAGVSKPSSSSSPLSTETLSSPGQKTQQSRSKSPAKASNTASSGRSTRSSSAACKREKITSAATVDASIDAHPELLRVKAKATEVAVAKSDHKVSAEGIAAKTVESETKTSLEMHPPPQGHEVELSQAQSLNIDFNISTLKDRKTSKEERNKHTEGEDNSSENYQILDSLDDQTDEQMDDGDQDGICETQQTGPEEGHTLHEDSCQVLDSVDDEGKALPEEYSEMEMDGSFQVLDSVTENKDDISTRKQLSEEDAITVVDNSGDKFAVKDAEGKDQEINNKENFQVLDTDSKQALSGMADGKRKRQKEEEIKGKILSVESCKASKNVENPDGQITNEDGDYKDDLKDHNSDITEQETFEVLDSIDDQTATEDDCQKLETPNDQISKEHIRPIEEEGDTYQVIDSLEDQPATTETESETDKKDKTKKGEAITRKDDGPSKRSGPTTTAAKNEEKEKSAKKQDRVVKKHETQMKRDTTAGVSIIDKEIEEATEEMVCEIVDSVEDEPVQDAATTERSGRRRSARGKKEDKITLNLREASQRPVRDEEATYKILDSVEDETANDEPTVTTRFTRGKRERTSFSSSSSKSTKGSSSSNSRSVSPKMSKDFTVSKPSSSSSPLSTETLFSAGQKTQESRTKSPAKASNTTFSRRSIRSSSAAHEKEKVMSAANVEASMESHPDLLREDAKATEVTVAKIKASSEIHSPPQEHGLKSSQAQGLEADFNVNALKDQKKSKEERKEGDVDKHTEEDDDDDGENYQILDSLDDQTDEQMDEGDRDSSTETLQTGPEKGHTLHDGSYQVLDSVDDEGKAHPEQHSEMDGSFQVLDNVTEDQAATGQEDSHLVQDDNSTVTQLSEEEANPVVDNSVDAVKDAVAENQETNGKDNLQVLDTGSIQAPKGMGDGKKKEQKEEEIEGKMRSAESCQAFKDVENPDGQIPNEDQPLQEPYKEDSLKDPDCHVTEQETFEVLDSIDDQTATEDDSQKRETSSGHLSKEHIRPIEEEGDTYQVIDSLEDQPATTETESETDKKGKRTKKGEAITRKDDGPSKRSGPTTTVSKSKEKEKSPKKQDRMIKKHETQTKRDTTVGVSVKDKEFEEATEEMVYEIVDSVEDEPVQDAATTERRSKRRSARGKKEDKITLNLTEASQRPIREEDAEYEILDSVEDETADDETTVTTRSTRGKRERTSKQDALIEKRKKEDTPTRRMRTPARESQERNREKTPKKEEKPPPKESTPTKKSDVVREVSEEDATYIIFDSVDDEIVKADPPATGQKGKRGRSKKEVKTTKEDSITLKKGDKDAFEKVTDEEEATYQILDSVEDETVDDKPPTGLSENSRKENISRNDEQTKNSTSLAGSTKNEEEEEPMFEIVDSLEDDQEELTATEVSDEGRKEKSQTISETPPKEESSGEKGDTPTCGATVVEMSGKAIVKEESLYEIVDDLEEVSDDPSAAEGSGRSNKKRASKTGKKKEDKSTTNSWSDRMTEEKEKKQKSPERNDALSILVNLDEVSDEEEDYPDDTTEEEELRKRQAATKERQFEKEREARRTRERERRSRSSSGRGGGDRGGTRRAKVRGKGNEEKVEEDTKEMVTLDEVGGDEPGEESVPESRDWDGEITEGETQALVTLDEFIEEEEDGTAEQCTLKTRPFSQEEGSVDSLNPESLVTVDGAGDDEEQAEKTSRSAKRQHNDDTEESTTFVTVDEVGEVEEEEETVTTVTRGRAKKRPRQTPVRKSTRGKKVSTKDEREEEEKEPVDVLPPASLDASSPSDKDPSTLSSDGQPEFQRKEVEAASRADVDAASAGQKPQPERPENQTVEGGEEEKKGWSRTDIKVVSKRRREPVGPEAKRSRSQSPCVAADFKLPPFKPNNPLGQEFVVPKSGYFCNLCSIFYLNEQTAKERHCSSQRHYDNLQKHYQKLEQKSSRTSTQSSQSSVSD